MRTLRECCAIAETHGVEAISQKYQFFFKSETAALSQLASIIVQHSWCCDNWANLSNIHNPPGQGLLS